MSLAAFALVASPLLAFLGVLLGHRVRRRNALALDRWHKREETMRLLRWETELAVDPEPTRASVGIAVLDEEKGHPPRARSMRASGASRPHATPEVPHPDPCGSSP
jgi:hypothetical protein